MGEMGRELRSCTMTGGTLIFQTFSSVADLKAMDPTHLAKWLEHYNLAVTGDKDLNIRSLVYYLTTPPPAYP